MTTPQTTPEPAIAAMKAILFSGRLVDTAMIIDLYRAALEATPAEKAMQELSDLNHELGLEFSASQRVTAAPLEGVSRDLFIGDFEYRITFLPDNHAEVVRLGPIDRAAPESPQPLAPPDTGNVGAKPYGLDDFFAEATARGLTIHDILPRVIVRLGELEATDLPPLPVGWLTNMTPDPEGTPAELFFKEDMLGYARLAVAKALSALPPGRGMVPMTQDEITNRLPMGNYAADFIKFARRIEEFHGIKGRS